VVRCTLGRLIILIFWHDQYLVRFGHVGHVFGGGFGNSGRPDFISGLRSSKITFKIWL